MTLDQARNHGGPGGRGGGQLSSQISILPSQTDLFGWLTAVLLTYEQNVYSICVL